jgi:hypothetical protein
MGGCARHYNKKLIMDLDDALWNIQPDNSAYEVFKKDSDGIKTITSIINEVDQMIVTNDYLKNIVLHNSTRKPEGITAIDNYIDLDLYTHRSPIKDTLNVNLMHFGSSSHFNDLAYPGFTKAIDRIMYEYPNVTFTTVGSFFSDLKMKYGARYRQAQGHPDLYTWVKDKYPKIMDDTDIVLAPLVDNVYNKGKSGTKFLEYSASKKPGVYQRLHQYEQYIEHGVNGYLAYTEDEWYWSIKKLMDSVEHRKDVGEKAFATVEANQIKDHVNQYAQIIKEVVDRGQ